ncbi:HipA family kinase [Janibacter sp. DB-40]|uniref:HipA family kinase n=1 Tax=Janibacter sp. DB-40 TaxID=3028808 RepID=UPI0024055658|nr:HipA family kinase [Janibacter sp. DB-40]
MLETVTATRFAVPLREGGSLPGLVEADDLGMYVVKFRGAGQGLKVLVAEILVGEIARRLDIPVPRLAVVDLTKDIARYEADEEVQDLLTASVGTNLGLDYLPGSFGYDGSRPATRAQAEPIVWLDAFTANVDRTWANPNLLVWGGRPWAIDHGAALYFHHSWRRRAPDPGRFADQPFSVEDHVLRDLTDDLAAVHERAEATLDDETLRGVIDLVPEEWLETSEHLTTTGAVRSAYLEHLVARRDRPDAWLPGGGR